ncbi:Rib/alpha-like domain-containing protein [Streptococcus sp. O1]|uniref:Rib/alpha-like domain-containing protein n=1 Tax=Streptococcus sp. O1 TaxID=2928735 RepID=UPI00211B2828|nr:Rib/alpha-like domain-containing protein [Streptococcus sp. O1]MCQ9213705.1 Rib/alpha-like domain-containing protein [Streptococcus sp. O1]
MQISMIPASQKQTVNMGDTPDPSHFLDTVPAGSQVSYKTPVDTSTPGDQATTVVVTYPDGSTDEIPVTITIVDPRSDADKHAPQGRVQTVTMGAAPTQLVLWIIYQPEPSSLQDPS